MEESVRQHLHAVVLRTLHAYNFTRSSTIASATLTDLLVRYIELLTSTCAEIAELSGRHGSLGVNVFDAVSALNGVGVEVEDLADFVQYDGKELEKYSLTKEDSSVMVPPTAVVGGSTSDPNIATWASAASRRADSLADLRAVLAEGDRLDDDDHILLQYRRVPTPDPFDQDDSASTSTASTRATTPTVAREYQSSPTLGGKGKEKEHHVAFDDFSMDISPTKIQRPISPTRFSPPTSKFSIGNPPPSPPSSPTSRKRRRSGAWSPPPHIPDFLPPFPGRDPQSTRDKNGSEKDDSAARKRAPLPARAPLSSSVKSSYTKATPFSQSALAATPSALDLPPDTPYPSKSGRERAFSTSSAAQAGSVRPSASLQPLIAAYNMLQSDTMPATNPQRLRIAHLIAGSAPKRYSTPDTLHAAAQPTPPRMAAPAPIYPIPIDPKTKRVLPPPPLRPVIPSSTIPSIADLSAPYLQSVLKRASKEIIIPPMYTRTTQIAPPPPLFVPAPAPAPTALIPHPEPPPPEPVLYSQPINAFWNNTDPNTVEVEDQDMKKKEKKMMLNAVNERNKLNQLADAKLYATWDWTAKDSRDPLIIRRGRMDSFAIGGSSSSGALANLPSAVQSPAPDSGSPIIRLTNPTAHASPRKNSIHRQPSLPSLDSSRLKNGAPNGRIIALNGQSGSVSPRTPRPPKEISPLNTMLASSSREGSGTDVLEAADELMDALGEPDEEDPMDLFDQAVQALVQ